MRVRLSDEERKERRRVASAAYRAANKEKIRTSKSVYEKNRYAEHKDARILYIKKWQEKNKELIKKRKVAYRTANPGIAREYKKAWRGANPEKQRAMDKRYRLKHPDSGNIHKQTRRARKKWNGGVLSKDIIHRLFILQRGKCYICKVSLKKSGHHLDHVIPLSKGGKNEDKNVQLACPACNGKKKDKDPIQFMQSLGYLL